MRVLNAKVFFSKACSRPFKTFLRFVSGKLQREGEKKRETHLRIISEFPSTIRSTTKIRKKNLQWLILSTYYYTTTYCEKIIEIFCVVRTSQFFRKISLKKKLETGFIRFQNVQEYKAVMTTSPQIKGFQSTENIES